MKWILTACLLTTFIISCSGQQAIVDLDFVVGTWQIEDRATYEEWIVQCDQLNGISYKLSDGERMISETLLIRRVGDNVIYEATVPSQNDGKTIPFTLNLDVSDMMSFENPAHDFPQKIQYQRISNDKILVHVLGPDDKGFSYHIVKQ